jgi:hypothetical protein
MRFERPAMKNRREILAATELLRVDAEGMKLSIVTKSLLAFTLTLFYSMFMYGTIRTIITGTMHDRTALIMAFVVLAVLATVALVVLIPVIFKDKIRTLIFTQKGILGPGLFNVKYEDIETYGWEICKGILATGQASKEKKITLRLTSNKGPFSAPALFDNFGNSIFGNYGYFFTTNQILQAEEILNERSIMKIPDRT